MLLSTFENTASSLLGQGLWQPLVTTFSSANKYTTLLHPCFVWRYHCCWFINIELMANSTVTHACTRLMKHTYFLHESTIYHSNQPILNCLPSLFLEEIPVKVLAWACLHFFVCFLTKTWCSPFGPGSCNIPPFLGKCK
jgi:hypothetical protein